jgi:hypothetical protein
LKSQGLQNAPVVIISGVYLENYDALLFVMPHTPSQISPNQKIIPKKLPTSNCLKLKAIEESVLGKLKNATASLNWSLTPPKTALSPQTPSHC